MLDDELLEHVADFYGSFTVDELAERLGTDAFGIMEFLNDLIDDNLDDLFEEMGYLEEETDDGEE